MTEGMPPAPPAPAAPPPMTPSAGGRPQGATVIAVIEAILGVLALLGALVLIGIGGLAGGIVGASGGEGSAAAGGLVAGFGIVGGLIFGLIGVLYIAIAYGVWKARSWSWMLGVAVTIVGLVFAVLGLTGGISISSIISLALPIVVLYYFMQPDVKRWLGRPA